MAALGSRFNMEEQKLVNENILEQLKNGIAKFELVSSPVPSISTSNSYSCPPTPFFADNSHRFFARIGQSLGRGLPAMKKVEHYSVQKVTGDGRCLFRAMVKGMAFNKGISLNPREERDDADDLRMAVKEVVCDSNKERHQYEEALIAITVDESLKRYCQRISRPDFWGGESELLVLSKLCGQPIIVYIPEHEHTRGGRGSGFISIAEYGTEFHKGSRKGKPRKVVRLLYSETGAWGSKFGFIEWKVSAMEGCYTMRYKRPSFVPYIASTRCCKDLSFQNLIWRRSLRILIVRSAR